jgi:hypothetical protein
MPKLRLTILETPGLKRKQEARQLRALKRRVARVQELRDQLKRKHAL